MNTPKKALALLLTLPMTLGLLAGCSGNGASSANAAASQPTASAAAESNGAATETPSTVKGKIVVFTLKASGALNDAVSGYLDSLSQELNFEYDVRYKGEDAADYLSRVQTAISEGFNGIITMKDEGNTNEIVAMCEENDVYFGNTWNNQGSSLNASSGGYAFMNNPYFVGGLVDCEENMAKESDAFCKEIAEAYEALPEDQKEGSIGMVTMPPAWQPAQVSACENMYQMLVGEYGIPESAFALNSVEQRAEEEMYSGKPVPAGSYIWPTLDTTSRKMESKYFDSNPNLQLLISTMAYTFINPALDSANKLQSIKVWCTGFDVEDSLINNFGSKGNATYQGVRTAPIECIGMPLIQILDQLNGNSYADKDEQMAKFAEITDQNKFALKALQLKSSSTIIIMNDEQMDAYLNHNVYGTGNGADSMITAAEMKQLMVTYNPDATFEDLLAVFGGNSSQLVIETAIEMAK